MYFRFLVVICYCLILGCATKSVEKASPIRQDFLVEKQVREFGKQAELLYQAGEYDEAEGILKEMLLLNDEDLQANYRMGSVFFAKGDVAKASVFFGKVTQHDPKNAKANYNLGVIHLMQAQLDLQRYAATSPSSTDIRSVMKILREIDDFAKSNALQRLVRNKKVGLDSIKQYRLAKPE